MKSNRPTKRLVVFVGPTASGKTDVGIRLAQALHTEIVSSDSRQIYREMSIGTAKPTPEELAAVPHHLIGTHSITEEYSAGRYETEALAVIAQLFDQHDTLLLVGGSGLYVDAVCEGLDALPQSDPSLRQQLTDELREKGITAMAERLRHLDPLYYDRVDRQNPQRILRAVEVCLQTGRPYSQLRHGQPKQRPFEIIRVGIDMPRPTLYERIDRRVGVMADCGLEQEARALYPMRQCNALQTVGYKEFFGYFEGQQTLDQTLDLIRRNTRHYAKRQLTWFGRDLHTTWFKAGDSCAAAIKKHLDALV